MHKLKMGLAVLATSTAVFIPAGSASADFIDVDVCSWAYTGCVTVPADIAIVDNTVCGIQTAYIQLLLSGQWVSCNKPGLKARVHGSGPVQRGL